MAQNLEVYVRKWIIALMVPLMVAMVAFVIHIGLNPIEVRPSLYPVLLGMQIIKATWPLWAVLFLTLAILGIWGLFLKGPSLIISTEGILFRYITGSVTVNWTQLAYIVEASNRHGSFLVMGLKNPEEYESQQPRWQRWGMRQNRKQKGGSIVVSFGIYKIKPETLKKAIFEAFEAGKTESIL
jgi:hypothetical protein